MTIEKIGRTGSPPFLQLVECLGSFENLGAVKTGNDYKVVEYLLIPFGKFGHSTRQSNIPMLARQLLDHMIFFND